MDVKRLGIAAGFLVAGIGGLLWQINILQTEGYYYKLGVIICPMLIVMGIASLFLDISDLSAPDENGKQQGLSFSDIPTGWKAALVIGGIAGIGQLAFFEMGAPGL